MSSAFRKFFTSRAEADGVHSGTLFSATETAAALRPEFRPTSAANNFSDLKLAFEDLGKTPVPGISAATGDLISVYDNIEKMAAPSAGVASKRLTKTIEKLGYLVINVHNVNDSKEEMEKLVEGLRSLAVGLNDASKSNAIESFFNNPDDESAFDVHNTTLGYILSDLTSCLANATKRKPEQIRNDMEGALEQRRKELGLLQTRNPVAVGMQSHIYRNEITHIVGDFDSGNEVSGGAMMVREMHDNKIGTVGGKMSSNNKVTGFYPRG